MSLSLDTLRSASLTEAELTQLGIEIIQKPESTAQIGFLRVKSGLFGIVRYEGLVGILLPGSRIQTPGCTVRMPGEPIKASVSGPQIPQFASIQTVTDQGMILGAGLASRFEPISGNTTGMAKPSVPLIGDDSVIVCIAKHMQHHGIRHIIVNTFYKPETVKAELTRIKGLEFTFIDENSPSGTAGGLVKALQQGVVDRDKPILVMQGDAVTNTNLSSLLSDHGHHQPLATLGTRLVPDNQVSSMAIVKTDQSDDDGYSGNVLSYIEKPSLEQAGNSRLGSIGFYVLAPDAFDGFMHLGIQRWNERGEFDYAMDYFPWLLTQQGETGKRLRAKLFPEPFYWSDIGRPDQYLSTLHDIYEKNALFSLPEAPERYYNQGVIYWKNAREIADTSEFTAQGNVIMLPEPDPS